MNDSSQHVIIRSLGLCEYEPIWRLMQNFTSARTPSTIDEVWCLQHPPVYTQGQAGKSEHVLHANNIPVVKIDRGGQVTYHGPGQLVVYTLVDLQRRGLGVRDFVTAIEQSVIDLLKDKGVNAARKKNAPGVYVGEAKIAAVGLRVRHGRTFHGLSINVNMDLAPFLGINPCGYAGLCVTQVKDECDESSLENVQSLFLTHFLHQLGYTHASYSNEVGTLS
jgi:lipoyl(octanoyl) transferase